VDPEVTERVLEPRRRVLTVIWLAMLAATFAYPLLAYMLAPGRTAVDPDSRLVALLTALAVAQGLASLVIERFVLSEQAIRRRLSAPATEGAAAVAASAAERKLAGVSDLYQHGCSIRLALAESVAVFGFILFMLGLSAQAIIPFSVAAAVLVWLSGPRLDAFVARAREIDPTL